jgi:hypothetical protein
MEQVPLATVNVSAGGLLIESDRRLQLDSSIKFSIELPFLTDPVRAVGRVVHITESKVGSGRTVRYGIELVAVEGVTERQLLRFLSDLLG